MRVKKNRDTLEQSYCLYTEVATNPVAKSLYKKVIYAFNKEVARLMIEEGLVWKMPNKIGSLGIKRRKMKFSKLKFDWEYWKKTGESSFHRNEHTNEWYCFTHWKKKACRVKGKKSYEFILSRNNKRALAKQMQIDGEYLKYEIAPTRIKKNKKKDYGVQT